MGQIQTTACFCMVCALRIAFTFLNFLFIFYIKRGIYFEVLAHTIMETWQVQNLDELGEQAGDSGKGCILNSQAVCFLRGLFFFFQILFKNCCHYYRCPPKAVCWQDSFLPGDRGQ